jgi:hypothetical protein
LVQIFIALPHLILFSWVQICLALLHHSPFFLGVDLPCLASPYPLFLGCNQIDRAVAMVEEQAAVHGAKGLTLRAMPFYSTLPQEMQVSASVAPCFLALRSGAVLPGISWPQVLGFLDPLCFLALKFGGLSPRVSWP